MWWTAVIYIALLVSKSNAQLTSPSEAVCPGNRVIFTCQQTSIVSRWTINLPSVVLHNSAQISQRGSIVTFTSDPFDFEIHVVSNSSNSITSELQVTAVRQLNGVTVECSRVNETFMSAIRVVSVAAPSGVMTTYDQFTQTGASINITWSTIASSGADNYTIKVTPPVMPEQSDFTTTATSLKVILVYNVNFSINITAHNCAGSNSTIVPLVAAGCSPPSPPTNGSVSEYLSGSVGAMLTYQCNTGHIAPEQMTSTCLKNGSWIPIPQCILADDGSSSSRVAAVFIGVSLSISILLLFLIIITVTVLVIALKKKIGVKSKPVRDSNQDGMAYSETKHPGPIARSCQNQDCEEYSVISHPATSEESTKVIHPGKGDTLIIYADIGPSHSKRLLKPTSNIDDHQVLYSVLNQASLKQPDTKKPEYDKIDPCSIDTTLNLDSLLIQLKPQVTSKWMEFANVVGLSNLIKQLAKYSPDECIVEVCDQWLKSQPNNPTWRDVANVVKEIGLYQLANDILMAYETGELPITVDMDAIPEITPSDNEIPPPIPPKLTEVDMNNSLSLDYSYHKEFQKYEYKAAAPGPPKVPARPPKS